jgi:hypothetical protein
LEQVLELELKFYFFDEPELDSRFHLCVKLELRFSVWVTWNWPGQGLTFRTREPEPVLGQKKVFEPIPGLGWNENIERYLPDTSQYKAGMFKS